MYHPHAAMQLPGGERAGMQRLQYYIWGSGQEAHQPATAADQGGATAGIGAVGGDPGQSSGARGGSCGADGVSATAAAEAAGLGEDAGGFRTDAGERARQAPLQTFKETRMLAGGADSSTQLSAFLAAGCLSPRMVHAAITAAAEQLGDEQTQWLIMHLIIRHVMKGFRALS